eukprot:CAMPEP_0180069578 /NCGR_PEP_ID=MMETSP0985-20121206/11081_1 /TAXON_ID=483367 /ORGANISM="non described non described, Strain CCMP 2436" /LENGTH=77 /DNA_ID=CAMNT_0022000539 /DNA_START=1 /DNA_END=235 /DNA_ORIENTATION=-
MSGHGGSREGSGRKRKDADGVPVISNTNIVLIAGSTCARNNMASEEMSSDKPASGGVGEGGGSALDEPASGDVGEGA